MCSLWQSAGVGCWVCFCVVLDWALTPLVPSRRHVCVAGLVYRALGFPPQFFTVLFAVPRVTGYLSHWKESLTDPDTKILRPQQDYRVSPVFRVLSWRSVLSPITRMLCGQS